MPAYRYKAVNKEGLIVKNSVEAVNKLSLSKKLKMNGLAPISISAVMPGNGIITTSKKDKKRNIDESLDDVLKSVKNTKLDRSQEAKTGSVSSIKNYMARQKKVTERDLVIFTQNFYLLKKANFNNLHALETIIRSTDNLTFVEVLKDILVGVEAGDYMYKTMEFYPQYFPYIYINMVRVGELSGSLENSLLQAVEYLDSNTVLTKKLRRILIPNLLQFILLIVMLFVGSVFALPQVEGVIEEIGADLNTTIPKATLMFQAFMDKKLIFDVK